MTYAVLTWASVLEDLYRLLVVPVLVALAALVAARINAKQKADERASLQKQLQQHALDAVATVYQQIVKPLKNPASPGEFNDDAKKAALEQAKSMVRAVAGDVLERIATESTRDSMLTQLVERAVVELGTKTPAGTDPKPVARVEVSPAGEKQ